MGINGKENGMQNGAIRWTTNTMPKNNTFVLSDIISEAGAAEALAFHKTVPGYQKTPLYPLHSLARYLGVADILVKDESARFGLNAFKALGAGYAIAEYMARKLGKPLTVLDYGTLASEKTKKTLGDITFYSATDGNHGRAVAWFATKLGQKARIYMPKGSSRQRLDNILATGAYAEITGMNYDDTVRYASAQAKAHGGVVVQDTAWPGYEEIPTWIMQGYTAMGREIADTLTEAPTHVFLQAGVGSFAGAMEGYFVARYKDKPPRFVLLEPAAADCHYQSAIAADGRARSTTGDMQTLMAGLACGEPNTVSFEILKNHTSVFTACDDVVAAIGMRLLGNPLQGDARIVSGESGAATAGLLYLTMTDPRHAALKRALGLNGQSRVLLISSEGDTDPGRYRRIVWNGMNHLAETLP